MHMDKLFAAAAVKYAYEGVNTNVSHPESNAPLNNTLAYYNLEGFNGPSTTTLTHSFIPTTCGANLSIHHTDPSVWGNLTGTASKPIVLLTHGYPESSYIWRDVTPAISARVPVFVPDQPGYGLSTPCCNATGCNYDKRTYAQSLMEAVTKIYGNVSVIYAGHDRGARTMVLLT
jgi:pimeloyl-ACP methyl ester carboxylesterase